MTGASSLAQTCRTDELQTLFSAVSPCGHQERIDHREAVTIEHVVGFDVRDEVVGFSIGLAGHGCNLNVRAVCAENSC